MKITAAMRIGKEECSWQRKFANPDRLALLQKAKDMAKAKGELDSDTVHEIFMQLLKEQGK